MSGGTTAEANDVYTLVLAGACVVLLIAACWYFRLAVLRYLVGCCGKSSSDKDSSDSGCGTMIAGM